MRVLRLVQVCVHRPGGKGDGSGVQDAETFALEVVLEVVFGLERGRFPVGLSNWVVEEGVRDGIGEKGMACKRVDADESMGLLL